MSSWIWTALVDPEGWVRYRSNIWRQLRWRKKAILRGLVRWSNIFFVLSFHSFPINVFLQTFGDNFASDGRLQGTESIQTISCSPPGTCTIPVPAPCAALVFLSSSSSALTEHSGSASRTFPTTVLTRTMGTATVDPAVLATSNGHTGMDAKSELGSTSKGSFSGALGMKELNFWGMVVNVVLGLVGWVLLVIWNFGGYKLLDFLNFLAANGWGRCLYCVGFVGFTYVPIYHALELEMLRETT